MLLPHPCTPRMITPRGGSRPKARACSSQEPRRWARKRFRLSSPPTLASVSETSTKSSIWERFSSAFLASSTSVTTSGVSAYCATMACEIARSDSSSVSPRRFSATASRPPGSSRLCRVCVFETRTNTSSMIWRRRWRSGRGSSRKSTRLASSGGIEILGAVRITVRRFVANFCPTSRRRRTTTGSSMCRCRSFRMKAASIEMPSRLASILAGSRLS